MKKAGVMLGAVLLSASLGASAQNYTFDCITYYRASDCAIGEAQLAFRMVDRGSSVDFLFSNDGPLASSITDIYFDWSNSAYALTPGSITDSGDGVYFRWGALPPELPGGSRVSFVADLSSESSPSRPAGIDPGEWVSFNFNGSYANFVAGLNAEQLRIGVLAKGFPTGGAESYVVAAVPEPETYAMLLAGMTLMGFVARRRRARALL